jgi:hypothetical protein
MTYEAIHVDCTTILFTTILLIMRGGGGGQYEQGGAASHGPSTVQQVHFYPSYTTTPRPTHISSGIPIEGA